MNWKEQFESSLLQKGWLLYRSRKISPIQRRGTLFQASVLDQGQIFLPSAKINGYSIDQLQCTCDAGVHGEFCPHEAALLFELEDYDDLEKIPDQMQKSETRNANGKTAARWSDPSVKATAFNEVRHPSSHQTLQHPGIHTNNHELAHGYQQDQLHSYQTTGNPEAEPARKSLPEQSGTSAYCHSDPIQEFEEIKVAKPAAETHTEEKSDVRAVSKPEPMPLETDHLEKKMVKKTDSLEEAAWNADSAGRQTGRSDLETLIASANEDELKKFVLKWALRSPDLYRDLELTFYGEDGAALLSSLKNDADLILEKYESEDHLIEEDDQKNFAHDIEVLIRTGLKPLNRHKHSKEAFLLETYLLDLISEAQILDSDPDQKLLRPIVEEMKETWNEADPALLNEMNEWIQARLNHPSLSYHDLIEELWIMQASSMLDLPARQAYLNERIQMLSLNSGRKSEQEKEKLVLYLYRLLEMLHAPKSDIDHLLAIYPEISSLRKSAVMDNLQKMDWNRAETLLIQGLNDLHQSELDRQWYARSLQELYTRTGKPEQALDLLRTRIFELKENDLATLEEYRQKAGEEEWQSRLDEIESMIHPSLRTAFFAQSAQPEKLLHALEEEKSAWAIKHYGPLLEKDYSSRLSALWLETAQEQARYARKRVDYHRCADSLIQAARLADDKENVLKILSEIQKQYGKKKAFAQELDLAREVVEYHFRQRNAKAETPTDPELEAE